MEQEIPEKQPGEALREMLARSQRISGQVPPAMQQPVPFVPPPKKVLSAKGKRKRLIFIMLALCFGIPVHLFWVTLLRVCREIMVLMVMAGIGGLSRRS